MQILMNVFKCVSGLYFLTVVNLWWELLGMWQDLGNNIKTRVDSFIFWHLLGSMQQPLISSYETARCQECISLVAAFFLLKRQHTKCGESCCSLFVTQQQPKTQHWFRSVPSLRVSYVHENIFILAHHTSLTMLILNTSFFFLIFIYL